MNKHSSLRCVRSHVLTFPNLTFSLFHEALGPTEEKNQHTQKKQPQKQIKGGEFNGFTADEKMIIHNTRGEREANKKRITTDEINEHAKNKSEKGR